MPRRIIYLRNPSQGSHFRVLGGSGGAGTSSPKPKKQKPPKPGSAPTPGDTSGVGYSNPGYQTPTDWFVHHGTPGAPDFGSYDGPGGSGPYDIDFSSPYFEPADKLIWMLYDIY